MNPENPLQNKIAEIYNLQVLGKFLAMLKEKIKKIHNKECQSANHIFLVKFLGVANEPLQEFGNVVAPYGILLGVVKKPMIYNGKTLNCVIVGYYPNKKGLPDILQLPQSMYGKI